MRVRKRYSPDQKVMILRELLENNIPISQLAEKYHVHVNDIYNWKKNLFESATKIFGKHNNKSSNKAIEQKKIVKLESTLRDHDEAINYLF